MTIVGETPKECFDTFGDHVRKLVADTLPTQRVVLLRQGSDPATRNLVLHNPPDDVVALKSPTHGRIYVSLAQSLRALLLPNKKYELRTCAYWYKVLQDAPGPLTEALFRWEYEASPPQGQHCNHHFQIGKVADGGRAIEVPLSSGTVDLNRLHMPTGYVLIEYVIRFLIVEFRIEPPCGPANWQAVLKRSEDKFFHEFSPKTSAAAR